MRLPVDPGASPPSGDEVGGTKDTRRGPITGRDVAMVTVAVVLTLGVATYLHSEFGKIRSEINEVRIAVHENARKLAVVETQVVGLRRDVEGLKVEVTSLKKHAAIDDGLRGNILSMAEIAP